MDSEHSEYSFTASFYYTETVYAQDETHSANSGLPVLTLQKDTSESSQWVFFFFNFSTTLHSLKKKDLYSLGKNKTCL